MLTIMDISAIIFISTITAACFWVLGGLFESYIEDIEKYYERDDISITGRVLTFPLYVAACLLAWTSNLISELIAFAIVIGVPSLVIHAAWVFLTNV